MHFENGHLYHIYNQGNNHQRIFYCRENYLFFLKKLKVYVLPYADILAWCLMPNHFHLMVRVRDVVIELPTHRVTPSHPVSKTKQRTLNQSIAILLRSYTRAINKQVERSGSLFREDTKAECLTRANHITPSFYNTKAGTQIHVDHPEWNYPQVCFNYIHLNPVAARLVKVVTDWEFSSACDYAGERNGNLINKGLANKLLQV